MPKQRSEPYQSDFTTEQIARRRDEALRRALNAPPKPHKDMKLGKRKPKTGAPPSKRDGA